MTDGGKSIDGDGVAPAKIAEGLARLTGEIAELRSEVRELTKICSRMDSHITFVNRTYDHVRKPMAWMMNKATRLMGRGDGCELEVKKLPPSEEDLDDLEDPDDLDGPASP